MRARTQSFKERHVTGAVEWVQRGDVFVRYSEIDGYGFRSMKVNQTVEFGVTQGPQATGVRAV